MDDLLHPEICTIILSVQHYMHTKRFLQADCVN